MEQQTETNKAVVKRFNQEIIESGNPESVHSLMDEDFINRTAPEGFDNCAEGMLYFFNSLLRPALPDLKVTIYEQVAEGDLVTTRKAISGTHKADLMGIAATGKEVRIEVIDIVRIKNGRYFEHWGLTTLTDVLQQLKS